MRVLVKTLTGKTLSFEVEGNETIGKLKERIQDKEGIPPESYPMYFAGWRLLDDRTFADYGFHCEVTLTIMLRLGREDAAVWRGKIYDPNPGLAPE